MIDVISDVVARGGYDQIVSGGATGADSVGEYYARDIGKCGLIEFPADWDKYGRAAGPRRNEAMARYTAQRGGGIVAFEGGKGTADMLRRAKKHGITIEYNDN